MSINGQGHSLTLVKGHSDFKVKCLNFGLYTQVSDSGPLGPLVWIKVLQLLQEYVTCLEPIFIGKGKGKKRAMYHTLAGMVI